MTSDDLPAGLRPAFEDDFDAGGLDPAVWYPHYLPAWSSRAETAASYEVRDSGLRLFIPPEQGRWLAGVHSPPLRVSGVQSGNFSGPVGSTIGQHPWQPGMVVSEAQERFEGWLPRLGFLEMRARAVVTPRSMVAWWLIGFEDEPDRSGEICVAEIFGDAVEPGRSAAVGMGLHAFRDPHTPEDFEAVRVPIDVALPHVYAVDWTEDAVEFFIDGVPIRRCERPPTYPMQSMLAVFDFPDRSVEGDDDAVPELVVDVIRGYVR
jgi:hypothetical protein